MSAQDTSNHVGRISGQLIFAAAFLLISVFLLSQIGEQTKWVAKTKFFAQPRFWPAVGLIGMVVFGGAHLWNLPRRRLRRSDVVEARKWVFVVEYALWFLVYVWAVPIIGYLPATLILVPLMLWRLGYRNKLYLTVGTIFGFGVVVFFKSFLEVKIPGGLIYEYLPGALRSFFILNFCGANGPDPRQP